MLSEIFVTVNSANHVLSNLSKWMKKQKRKVHFLYFPAKNYVLYQPVGVVGIIVPWNYPIVTGIVPLIEAIAAGNNAMVKMSEYTPHTNALLKSLFREQFSESEIAFIEGDASVAAEFSKLKFDHLIFTGSSEVGKKVMQSAAPNLTPVTLELGGKSPTIISESAKLRAAIKSICFGKVVNSGQTCIAPDYIFCHSKYKKEFLDEFTNTYNKFYPKKIASDDYTCIINDSQFNRLETYIEDAKTKGAEIKILSDFKIDKQKRKFPLTIVLNVNQDMLIAKNEIFGPILPVYFYDDFSNIVEKIQIGERPLALYYFGFKKSEIEMLSEKIHSGALTINETLMHIAQDSLPFGGVGYSGIGAYHGFEGFKTFSHAKSIHKKYLLSTTQLISPPYPNLITKILFKIFIR